MLEVTTTTVSPVEISNLDEQVPAVSETARDFDFHAEHNGEACIESLRPEDVHTPNAFRFTIAMLCTIYAVPKQTMHDNIDSLLEDEEIAQSDISYYAIPGGNNRTYETALYNLTVLNRLGMCCFRKNKEAKKVRDKFNDVLVKHETGVTQPELSDEEIMSRALEIAHKTLALREERIKALQAERDEAIRTKTQYQSNLAAQMSGRVGGLTSALNRVKLENDRLKGDRLTKDDVYIIMQTQGVSFTLKTVKDVIRDALNTISEYLDEPFPKIKTGEHTDGNGKVFDVQSYVYTRKTVKAFFEYVENNPLGWQARNRKFILNEWLNHGMTIPT